MKQRFPLFYFFPPFFLLDLLGAKATSCRVRVRGRQASAHKSAGWISCFSSTLPVSPSHPGITSSALRHTHLTEEVELVSLRCQGLKSLQSAHCFLILYINPSVIVVLSRSFLKVSFQFSLSWSFQLLANHSLPLITLLLTQGFWELLKYFSCVTWVTKTAANIYFSSGPLLKSMERETGRPWLMGKSCFSYGDKLN